MTLLLKASAFALSPTLFATQITPITRRVSIGQSDRNKIDMNEKLIPTRQTRLIRALGILIKHWVLLHQPKRIFFSIQRNGWRETQGLANRR
jgi:hypothetical protein